MCSSGLLSNFLGTIETSEAVQQGTVDARSQGAALASAAGGIVENTLSTAAEALESLHLQEKAEAVGSKIQNVCFSGYQL